MYPEYKGSLNHNKMPDHIRSAYWSFYRQKKSEYGCTYKVREFIHWWLENLKTKSWNRPTCGRLDHSKGYSWDNIEMQEMADNSREMVYRTNGIQREKAKGKKILVKCKQTDEVVNEFNSIRETAQHFGVSQRLVQFIVYGKYKHSKKVLFNLEAK